MRYRGDQGGGTSLGIHLALFPVPQLLCGGVLWGPAQKVTWRSLWRPPVSHTGEGRVCNQGRLPLATSSESLETSCSPTPQSIVQMGKLRPQLRAQLWLGKDLKAEVEREFISRLFPWPGLGIWLLI